jgi:hypothetical protein
MFSFTRFYLRVLAERNEIVLRLKRNVILRKSMIVMGFQYRIPLQSQREFHASADAP